MATKKRTATPKKGSRARSASVKRKATKRVTVAEPAAPPVEESTVDLRTEERRRRVLQLFGRNDSNLAKILLEQGNIPPP